VILCDHTKLGVTEGLQARLTMESLLERSEECIFLSTYPSAAEDEARVRVEIDAFNAVCADLKKSGACRGKELALWLITENGQRRIAGSLATMGERGEGEVANTAAFVDFREMRERQQAIQGG
jgi:hypothetical protein